MHDGRPGNLPGNPSHRAQRHPRTHPLADGIRRRATSPHPGRCGSGHREGAAAHTATSTLNCAATQGLWGIAMADSTKTPLPIVVGIDGSQAAIEAAEWAIDEAVR